MPPARIPMPFLPGHFTGTNNASFVLDGPSANTPEAINAYLKSQSYENWRVCDGTAPNEPESLYFNTENKYLPNLTDDRFLMGNTITGSMGGQNSALLNQQNIPPHRHQTFVDPPDPGHQAHSIRLWLGGGGHTRGNRMYLSGATPKIQIDHGTDGHDRSDVMNSPHIRVGGSNFNTKWYGGNNNGHSDSNMGGQQISKIAPSI